MENEKEKERRVDYKETIENLKLTWKYTKGSRLYLFGFLIFTILLCAISIIVPIFSAKLLIYVNHSQWESLIKAAIGVFVFEIFRNLSRFFYRKMSMLFFRKTLTSIQVALSKEILSLETEEIDNNSSGLFIVRLNSDSSNIAVVFERLISVITEIITNIGVIGGVYVISKTLCLYFVLTIIILYVLNRIRMKKRFEKDKELRKINEKNTGLIGEMVRGLKDVKVLNSEKNFITKVESNLVEANNTRYKMSNVDRVWDFWIGSLNDLFSLLFILIGIKIINMGYLTVESFIIVYMYRNRLYNLTSYFSMLAEHLKDFNLSSTRVFDIFKGEKFKKESFGKKKLNVVKGNFEFKNVSFQYKEDQPILKDISFKIKANETVAFVGRSGGGKSTIFSLLTRLYHPQSGEILIDGYNVDDLTKETLRGNVSIITQNPYIFNMSIKENLQVVKPNLTEKEMKKACKDACLEEFIESLPDKYDTVVGEGGVTLSGGQRQRLAIARAFIRKTEIILFDEATSALDNETQEQIQKAITNLQKTKTILIIAHRLSTVINADRILVVDDGKIVGEGTHKDLLKSNKLYKELYTTELKK